MNIETKVWITVAVLLSLWAFNSAYWTFSGPAEGRVAVSQLVDSDVEYIAARALGKGVIPSAVNTVVCGALIIFWVVTLRNHYFGCKKKG